MEAHEILELWDNEEKKMFAEVVKEKMKEEAKIEKLAGRLAEFKDIFRKMENKIDLAIRCRKERVIDHFKNKIRYYGVDKRNRKNK